ncbi:MAG: OsmC family protein [Saprospiraceae bacterium]|nr:OsmC family protein [Saprospiraceae bacterium]MCB9326301.1 OsmC family protein [Lewinellaceae bacterium]
MLNTVHVNWKEKMQFDATVPGGVIPLDADEAVGGEGQGARSKPLMLAALAGCTAMDVASLIKKMRAEVDDFSIDVSGDLTDEHPKFYKTVKVVYDFYGADMKKDKIQKAVDLSVERYCGVMEMFRKFAEIEIVVNFHEKE